MAFFDEQFPPCYSFGARGGPMFSTEVNRTAGGQRFANQNWTLPDHIYDISSGIKGKVDFEIYRAFFYNVKGQADAFRFKDWMDFEATMQPTVAISVGSTYQLQRAYRRGSRTFTRKIVKPIVGRVVVTRRSSGGSTTVISPSIDYSTGIVTVTGHTTGDTYLWTGEFDVPVNFTSDAMEAEISNKSKSKGLLINWPNVQVRENRNPG